MPTGAMLCDDLIFFSRVAAVAQAHGLVVHQVKSPAALVQLAQRQSLDGVILDLQNDGLDLPTLLAELKTFAPTMPRTIAFGSHVLADALRKARQAGCDRVMPRSQFAAELDSALPAWLAPTSHET